MTTKTKYNFERYLEKKLIKGSGLYSTIAFYRMPESMQWGVKVDYFDSCGIYIILYANNSFDGSNKIFKHHDYEFEIEYDYGSIGSEQSKTRQEARQEALKEASEIREEQL